MTARLVDDFADIVLGGPRRPALEEAEGYRQLIKRHGHTQDDVAQIVHKSRSHVANLLRLLDLPDFVRQSLLKGDISMGHARAVATAPDAEVLTREIIPKGLSVRQTEEQARREKAPGPGADIGRASARNAPSRRCRSRSARATARRHSRSQGPGRHKGQGGAVTLHYSSLDQLDMICQRLAASRSSKRFAPCARSPAIPRQALRARARPEHQIALQPPGALGDRRQIVSRHRASIAWTASLSFQNKDLPTTP